MALSDITFVKGKGGLGRPLAGEDHISGLLVFNAALPAGYGASDRIHSYQALRQAETDGITEGDATWGILWYHISEFFRLNPKGILWVMIATVPAGAYDFSELIDLQSAADGKIRQVGVRVDSTAFVVGHVTALQAVYATLAAAHQPLHIVLCGDVHALTDITTLPDLRVLDAPNVSVLVSQDGGNDGAALYAAVTKTIGCLGALLGAISLAKVSESIAWVAKFPMAGGTGELDVPAFGNGQKVKDLSSNELAGIDTKGYIFLRKFVGLAQTYFQSSNCATEVSDDYAYIENNRTIDKAIRNVRVALLPELNAPVLVDPTNGQLDNDYVEYLKGLGDEALAQMARDGELSGYQTIIDPTQDVLATGQIVVSLENVPVGVSRNFVINIGFAQKLSQ